jgi:hypothetical protein
LDEDGGAHGDVHGEEEAGKGRKLVDVGVGVHSRGSSFGQSTKGEEDCLRLHICMFWRRARHLLLLQHLEGKWPAAVQASTCAAQTSQQSLIRCVYIPTTSR